MIVYNQKEKYTFYIMSTKDLYQKLFIKPNYQILIINSYEDYVKNDLNLPETFQGIIDMQPLRRQYNLVKIFLQQESDIDKYIIPNIDIIKNSKAFWVCYQKQTSGIKTDLNRDILLREIKDRFGFKAVSLIAINEIWSCMRFRISD
jgi:hypothetical protein